MRTARHLGRSATPAAALTAALALAACGSGKDATTSAKTPAGADPAVLAKQAFGPNAAARSGQIDGEIRIAVTGSKTFAAPFSLTMSGPFEDHAGHALPDYDIQLGAGNYGSELSAVGGKSYVSLGTTGYQVPATIRRRLVHSAAKGTNGLTRTLEQFGIAIGRWETKRRVAGTELVDGVPTVHVATGVDVRRVLLDANTLGGLQNSLGISRATGLPPKISRAARDVLVRSVTSASGGSWIGAKDHVLRKAGFTVRFAVAKADRHSVGGISAATVTALLNVTDVGKPQRIAKPPTIGAFADFKAGLSALGDAQDARSAP
jgi:hypothetical protein